MYAPLFLFSVNGALNCFWWWRWRCVFSDGWCGLLSSCPTYSGQDVEIGCYVQYEWLSQLLQYNPIISINASIEFLDEPLTLRASIPIVPSPSTSPPAPEAMRTTHTVRNVQPGQTISHTCRVLFVFDRSNAYSGRNVYAKNPLEWTCTVQQPVTGKWDFFHIYDFVFT